MLQALLVMESVLISSCQSNWKSSSLAGSFSACIMPAPRMINVRLIGSSRHRRFSGMSRNISRMKLGVPGAARNRVTSAPAKLAIDAAMEALCSLPAIAENAPMLALMPLRVALLIEPENCPMLAVNTAPNALSAAMVAENDPIAAASDLLVRLATTALNEPIEAAMDRAVRLLTVAAHAAGAAAMVFLVPLVIAAENDPIEAVRFNRNVLMAVMDAENDPIDAAIVLLVRFVAEAAKLLIAAVRDFLVERLIAPENAPIEAVNEARNVLMRPSVAANDPIEAENEWAVRFVVTPAKLPMDAAIPFAVRRVTDPANDPIEAARDIT